MVTLKSPAEIEKMRVSGRAVGEILAKLKKAVQAGIKTQDLDDLAAELIKKKKAKSAFLNYHGYPKQVCVSVNDEVVHGIPGSRVIQNGDIVSVDFGLFIDGYCGDSAFTVIVGKSTSEVKKLVQVTEESLMAGIEKAVPGNRLGDISHAVQTVAEKNGFSVVRDFVGHGIGQKMHEDPQVPNYGPPNRGPRLQAGMVLAIEPMINLGDYRVRVLDDGWTVVTDDGLPSAHFEHTVAILETGPEILTLRPS